MAVTAQVRDQGSVMRIERVAKLLSSVSSNHPVSLRNSGLIFRRLQGDGICKASRLLPTSDVWKQADYQNM
jgi:hypothetical protein